MVLVYLLRYWKVCQSLKVLNILFMKEQFVFNSILRPTLQHIMFLQKFENKQLFCGHKILTECVFVTQLYINVGISICWFVCVMTNCQFMSDTVFLKN